MSLQGADQTPLPWATPCPSLKMAVQSVGFSQGANPEQATDAPVVNQQMQGLIQFLGQFGNPLQCEDISAGSVGMATVAEALQLLELRWAQPSGSSSQVSLSQGLTSQAPAARSPSESPGRRVR